MGDRKTRETFLKMELPQIISFLDSFEFRDPRIETDIQFGEEWEYMKIINFPLPDGYNPDYENIGIVTVKYPDFGPAGIHIYNDSPNLAGIRQKLGGHVIETANIPESYKDHVEELDGWTWICFHYQQWKWNFKPANINKGDNLFKFILSIHANLSGNFQG